MSKKSLYISADTIYTGDVEQVLKEYRPDISILACGTAQLDVFQPLLMHMEDIIKFTKAAPGIVIANHMEALNHCPTTRNDLRKVLSDNGLMHKVRIPDDGEMVSIK